MNGEYAWFKVEPIIWIIRNWEDLPTVINPRGNGTAKYIDLKSEEGIMTLPFYINDYDENISMWQNSFTRAKLNGYDLHEELKKGNGEKNCASDTNFSFKGKGFLDEAFSKDIVKEKFTQEKITDVIHKISKDHTIILIAHRLSTIIESDKIFVLNDHSIEAVGTHKQLLKSSKTYKRIISTMESKTIVAKLNIRNDEVEIKLYLI